MLPKEVDKKFSIPPKLDAIYENFLCIAETASYRVFEAKKRNSHEKHSIRVLDPTKDFTENNFDSAARLFMQEVSHLQTRCPGSVLIKTLEISKARKQISCAVRHYSLVTTQVQEIEGSMDLKNPKVVEKLLNDVISDVEFLWRDLKMKSIASIIEPENIYYLKEKGTFFLGNWDKITEKNTSRPQDLTSNMIDTVESELRSQDIAAEIKALAFSLLKMKRVDVEALELLLSSKRVNISIYEMAVKAIVTEGFNNTQELQNLIERMLSLDPKNLPNLEEFKIKENEIQMPFEKANNEANTVRKEVGLRVEMEESKIEISSNSVFVSSPLISTSPTLLAWCTSGTNKISVIDLETKEINVTFDGARIINTGASWTHVKEIPSTKLLVSLYHNYDNSANMDIFDLSEKGKANKIYSLGAVSGSKLVTGAGDVTYNSRRSILGAIPFTGRIAYHLFIINTGASKSKETVKLTRKSKWHSQYSSQEMNYITGFDFNPAGDSIATIDRYGVCLISDVDTNNYVFHIEFKKSDYYGRRRWSTNTGEPLLFVKYDWKILNILDFEKKALILSNPVELDPGTTYGMDVCQSNGNLLVSGGDDKVIKIFDKRESKVVRIFEGVHSDDINCVRWNSNADMIASASDDGTVKLLDFKTGKVLHTGTTSDGKVARSVCFI